MFTVHCACLKLKCGVIVQIIYILEKALRIENQWTRIYLPLRAGTVYVHSDLSWQKRATDILIISSSMEALHSNWHLSRNLCHLLCFVMVGHNRHRRFWLVRGWYEWCIWYSLLEVADTGTKVLSNNEIWLVPKLGEMADTGELD